MEEENDCPVPGHQNMQEFSQRVLQKIVESTQRANGIVPLLEEYEYWNSFPNFKEFCAEEGSRIINDIDDLLRHNAVQCGWLSASNKLSKSATADIEERYDRIVDANDIMLETVGSLLDEASGLKKNDTPILPPSIKQSVPVFSSWNRNQTRHGNSKSSTFKLLMAKNIQRPQLKWLDKIDNSNTPFIPYIKEKLHALRKSLDKDVENMEDSITDDNPDIKHPYEFELSHLEPVSWQLECIKPQQYRSLDETKLTMVDNGESLTTMMNKLNQAQEIALDLEHHSYRSFQGFVCLMQLSTREEDFIVDTLKLRDELHVLNQVFTNPSIVKVLHGSDSDIGWLMRDFGLYIVNMFDTGQASRVLHEERFSLSHLLQKYCDVNAQKQFQLADWRIRPLPLEMIQYAREDTHYLLYVYDILRNKLIERGNEMNNLLHSVYTKSAVICSTIYSKPRLYEDSHMNAYNKYRGRLSPQQLECLRLLYIWRDKISRDEDESCGYTLPNHMMFQIAENLPKEFGGIIACCNPVPPLVKQNVMDIHRLVTDARSYDPTYKELTVNHSQQSSSQESARSSIKDSHIVTSTLDMKTGFEIYSISGTPVEKRKPSLTIFQEMVKNHYEIKEGKKKALEIIKMLRSPFEMYLPNQGMEVVHPTKITEAWKEASLKKLDTDETISSESKTVSKTTVKKTKFNDKESLILREMLPKKKKKKHTENGNEGSPITLNYDKNIKQTTDYVPFDYKKADFKKFSTATESADVVNLDNTEEPKLGGVIRTKVHNKSGMRTMTYK